MDPTVRGIFFVIAIVLAAVAAISSDPRAVRLFPLSFAVFVVPFAWDAFEAA